LTKAIINLDRSYLFIQGPPGTGKTYISANIITKLIASGKKVGVTSNSHEAIKNLLSRIERIAFDKKISFLGIRKASEGDDNNQNDVQKPVIIRAEKRSEKAKPEANPEVTLFAGTAWYFADKSFDFQLDYLFVEEAGQLSLANLIAIGMSAKNIILVGDQMQLSQPTQGVHPGSSGCSILQFLLHDDIESDIEQQTISPEKGVFLDMSYRMRPEICDLISKIFYNDRLHSHPTAAMRQLSLDDIGLSGSGVKLIIHEKEGVGKKNVQEAQIVKDMYLSLIGKIFIDHSQIKKEIGLDDILVISPYNLQVDYIKSILPQGAKVGTVDKFQGQEAPIVLISMSASSQDDISKDLEFLLNKQRLNVALSRAQCFAILILHKELLETKSNSMKQIKLINTLYKIDHLIKNDRHFKI
jgi:superfamily I DNA and/or RNA helicase